MIEKAKNEYHNIEFMVCNALDLPFESEWDIVFSNAVFHWINDHNALLKNIYKALKPKGILICEFGANGNISTIENAFAKASGKLGFKYNPKFNFPTVEGFSKLLKNNNFIIDKIYDYDRPTVLKDEEQGLVNWMRQFFSSEISMMPVNIKDAVLKEVEQLTKSSLWNGKEWVADYRRLRVIAHIK